MLVRPSQQNNEPIMKSKRCPQSKPTPPKLDPEAHRLWDAVVAANQEAEVADGFIRSVELLGGCLKVEEYYLQPPVNEKITALLQRAKDLANDWRAYIDEVQNNAEEIGWKFAKHAYDLDRSDYIKWRGRILKIESPMPLDSTVGNLILHCRTLSKAGVPCEGGFGFPLLHRPWTKISSGGPENKQSLITIA